MSYEPIRAASIAIMLVLAVLVPAQDLPPVDDAPELALISGEVVEIDVEGGLIIVHVVAVEDQDVEHFDLDVLIDEETLFENESDWEVETVLDLEGTFVDIEGFMDGDVFIADIVWVVEGPLEDEPVAVAGS